LLLSCQCPRYGRGLRRCSHTYIRSLRLPPPRLPRRHLPQHSQRRSPDADDGQPRWVACHVCWRRRARAEGGHRPNRAKHNFFALVQVYGIAHKHHRVTRKKRSHCNKTWLEQACIGVTCIRSMPMREVVYGSPAGQMTSPPLAFPPQSAEVAIE
jgi:hypothetical protein